MKTRILTLALAIILLMSAVTVPAAASRGSVYTCLKNTVLNGNHREDDEYYYIDTAVIGGGSRYFGIYCYKDVEKIEAVIYMPYQEVALILTPEMTMPYTVRAELYTGGATGYVSVPASYNGEAFTGLSGFSGTSQEKASLLEAINEQLPYILEYTQFYIYNEGGYTLKDMDLTKYRCHTDLHCLDRGTVTQAPTCAAKGCRVRTCVCCGETKNEEIAPTGVHTWTLTSVISTGSTFHESMGKYTCAVCGAKKEARLCAAEIFTDMPKEGNWAHKPIDWAYFNGITTGKTGTTFVPKAAITRAEAVTFLWTTLGKPEPKTADNPFTDVKPKAYYYKAILWAVENGVTTGKTLTTFAPKDKCTRAQIASLLWIAAGKPQPTITENPFRDVSAKKYYYKAVLWAVENGVATGTSATKFSPNATCTRAQVVAFLYNAFEFLPH